MIMNKHKEKCKQLKLVRKELADKLNIDLHQKECTYESECKGTCPKCEAEERKLNKALAGLGIALTTGLTLTGCGDISGMEEIQVEAAELQIDTENCVDNTEDVETVDILDGNTTLSGDVAYVEPQEETLGTEEENTDNNNESVLDDISETFEIKDLTGDIDSQLSRKEILIEEVTKSAVVIGGITLVAGSIYVAENRYKKKSASENDKTEDNIEEVEDNEEQKDSIKDENNENSADN